MRAMAAVIAFVAGESMNVTQVCRDNGIAPKTFYKYAARYRDEGLVGFEPRSRRPNNSPAQTSVVVEDMIVELRKRLGEDGLDHGAATIQWHLDRVDQLEETVPSIATIHRVLVRRGFVMPQPQKRPKSSWRRFEASLPNEMWQIDATDWIIATGVVRIFNIVDDHSRVACRSRAVAEATSIEAWTTFCQAAQRWGFPAAALSDNGLCFSGKLKGFEVLFESNLRDAGIRPITGRPYHPQTTGKVERFQQTLKKWLRQHDHRYGLATDLDDLQQRLDIFTDHYNTQRPHQGINRITPSSRWSATSAAEPAKPIEHPNAPPRTNIVVIDNSGNVKIRSNTTDQRRHKINVGTRWAGCTVTVIVDHHHATIVCGNHLVRHLRIDPDRYYQPSTQRRGGPRQPRHLT